MKNIFTIFLFVLSNVVVLNSEAQCCYIDNFSSSAGWTMSGTDYSIGPSNFSFNNTPCNASTTNPFNYATHPIGCTLSDSAWIADIDFNYSARGSSGVAHTLLAATAGTENIYNAASTFSSTNQDGIDVIIQSPYNGGQAEDSIFAQAKDGTLWSASSRGIYIYIFNTYYLRLERKSSTLGSLSVFTDPARTIHQIGLPKTFSISNTTTGLNVVQMGSIPQGYYTRALTGTLDNLKICDLTVTGLNENKNSSLDLNIYPNPSSSGFYFAGLSPESVINFYDLNGKELLLNKTSNGSALFVDTRTLQEGIYFAKIISKTISTTRKLSVIK